MTEFFDRFPRIAYSIDGNRNFDMPTNIMIRTRVLTEKLDVITHYYPYTIKEGETPEILAERFYDNPEAHWLILMTNNRTDAQYDWPLDYRPFIGYIEDKYGSVANAKTQVHHYERIITTVDNSTGTWSNNVIQISAGDYANSNAAIGSAEVKNVGSYTVSVYPEYRNIVYCYDWEEEENEKKRDIKVIRKPYYEFIRLELDRIMAQAGAENRNKNFIRKVK